MSRMICKEIKSDLSIIPNYFSFRFIRLWQTWRYTKAFREGISCPWSRAGDRAVIEAVAAGEPVGAANGLFSIHENCLLLLVRERRTLAFSKSRDAAKQDFLLLFYHGFSLL
ncbi:MAG: hypothetical protein SOT64_05635 [Candidatus Faecousia sp.]|nr:hypothetical protein [Candidatus Faecousia sp.]